MLIFSIKQINTIPFYLFIYDCSRNDLNLILKLQPKFPRARVKQTELHLNFNHCRLKVARLDFLGGDTSQI